MSCRLWSVYTRLIEICNPETSELANIELRKEFETKLRMLNSTLAQEASRSKEEYEALQRRLAEVEKAHEISRGTAETEVPRLRAELLAARERCSTVEADLATTIELSKQKDVALAALREQMTANQALLDPLTQEVKSARDELNHANQEIQRYIDMYLEADRVVRKNESSVNIAMGEKERLVVKIAGLMKQSEDKELRNKQTEERLLAKQQEVDTLHEELAEAKKQTEIAARNLGKYVASAKQTQAEQAAEIDQLQASSAALEQELDNTQTELILSTRLREEQQLHTFATASVSGIWQQTLALEKQRLHDTTSTAAELDAQLRRAIEENKQLQGIVVERDLQVAQLNVLESKFVACRAELDETIAARDAAVAKFEATDTDAMVLQVQHMQKDVLEFQDTVAAMKAEEYRQGKEIKMLRLDHGKKDKAISAGNVLCVTLLAVLSSLQEEGEAQHIALQNAIDCMQTTAEIEPISTARVKWLAKKLTAGQFEGVLNKEEQAVTMAVLNGCVSQRQALVDILPNLNQVPMLKKQVHDLETELRSLKSWAGNERIRNTKVLDSTTQQGILQALALREEVKIEKAEKESMRVGFLEMKDELNSLKLRIGDLQDFWDANHEPPVEEVPVEKEDSCIDFSQFDSDVDDEEVPPATETRAPVAPSAVMSSGARSNPRLPKVKDKEAQDI